MIARRLFIGCGLQAQSHNISLFGTRPSNWTGGFGLPDYRRNVVGLGLLIEADSAFVAVQSHERDTSP
jgi:hypothetical protein